MQLVYIFNMYSNASMEIFSKVRAIADGLDLSFRSLSARIADKLQRSSADTWGRNALVGG